MQGKRTTRVSHLLKMELSQLLLQKVRDPRLGFVTVTHVDVSPDLRAARVFYSVLGDAEKKNSTQIVLEQAAGFLQREIGASLDLRNTPKLRFLLDESLERGMEIDRVLKKIHDEDSNSIS